MFVALIFRSCFKIQRGRAILAAFVNAVESDRACELVNGVLTSFVPVYSNIYSCYSVFVFRDLQVYFVFSFFFATKRCWCPRKNLFTIVLYSDIQSQTRHFVAPNVHLFSVFLFDVIVLFLFSLSLNSYARLLSCSYLWWLCKPRIQRP